MFDWDYLGKGKECETEHEVRRAIKFLIQMQTLNINFLYYAE